MTTETAQPAVAKKRRPEKPWWNWYLAATFLGGVLFLAFFITGNGLGASGALQRVWVTIEDFFAPGHVDTTAYLAKYSGGSKNALDFWIVALGLGIPIGGFIAAWRSGRLKWATGKGPHISVRTRWIFAFLGGTLMGFGARFARGCTSGQGLSGSATLSVGSWAFLMAFFAGGYAIAFFVRKMWN